MQKKSPKSATLLKDGLRANLSPSEATAQLRVLCRKFAALTDKVKVGLSILSMDSCVEMAVLN